MPNYNKKYDSKKYADNLTSLRSSKNYFSRNVTAHSTGDFVHTISNVLSPKLLKKNAAGIGIRESCYDPAFNDLLSIVIAQDGTGSMSRVPEQLLDGLPQIIGLVKSGGYSDNVNVLIELFDDEFFMEDAAFQMSQFEAGDATLIKAINELVIPGCGGGNLSESYHLAIYAAAYHTRLESFDREGKKGFFILIGDERPMFEDQDYKVNGTKPALAKSVFGDSIQAEVPMLTSLKKLAERYHIYKIRPGQTSHGKDKSFLKLWQQLFIDAELNPQNIIEIDKTEDIVPTIAMTIGRALGSGEDEIVDVLKTHKVKNLGEISSATKSIVPVESAVAKGSVGELAEAGEGRERLS